MLGAKFFKTYFRLKGTVVPYLSMMKFSLSNLKNFTTAALASFLIGLGPTYTAAEEGDRSSVRMSRVEVKDGQFIVGGTGQVFTPWGVNYDHDRNGRLLEDYWVEEWKTVVSDFREMKALGFNVVRIHLQTMKFLQSPDQTCETALKQLEKLLHLAEETGLYVDLTGLGNYHQSETPQWYNNLNRQERWKAQSVFWSAVAKVGAKNRSVFCYNLMNEPIIGGSDLTQRAWVTGELDGKSFVQRIALELKPSETRKAVAEAWIKQMASAVQEQDCEALITLGVIPWAHVWPNAKPVFYNTETGQVDQALAALKVYDFEVPILIEEMFPLSCSADEMLKFVERSSTVAEGWISFYWGQTVEECESEKTLKGALIGNWIQRFSEYGSSQGLGDFKH